MAITFDDVRLDDKITYGSRVGPAFRTTIVGVGSGDETAVQHWQHARIRMSLSLRNKSRAQLDALIIFFRARRGRARAFRVKDWTDYQATDMPCLLLTTGADDTYQMQKTYTSAGQTETRNITKPVNGTVTIKKNGVVQNSGFSINYATGVLTVSPAQGGTWTWSGQFDVPMRFDTDTMDVDIEDFDVRDWSNVPLVEVLI